MNLQENDLAVTEVDLQKNKINYSQLDSIMI